MKIIIKVLFIFVILKGAYAINNDTKLPACESPPIKNCILTDATISVIDGETVWKTTEILLHHQVAQNFLSSGKNITIWNKDLLLFNGTNIVNKLHASTYQSKWHITEFITLNLAHDNNWGKVVINVTVKNFKPVDQIELKVVIPLADGDTLSSPGKHWFEYHKNDSTQTTTSPSPTCTPNITDRNATGKEEGTESTDIKEDTEMDDAEEGEHNEEAEDGKSSLSWTSIINIISKVLELAFYGLATLFGIWLYKKVNAIHRQMSGQYMPLSQTDTDGQQPQGSQHDTENLPMSAVVTQDT